VRAFISLPAGVAEMPLRRFIPLTLAGSVVWLSGLVLIGRAVGDNWEDLHRKLAFLDYVVVAAVIAGVAYLLIKRRGGGAKPEAGPEGEPAAEG
jgi:membrane protein DedA with SNARE-associated domain